MRIQPAMKVLHGKPAHEYYIVEVKGDSVLLVRTDSKIYNDGKFHQKYNNGKDKPYYPYWASIREIYISNEFFLNNSDTSTETN